jgi:hypothetical protein
VAIAGRDTETLVPFGPENVTTAVVLVVARFWPLIVICSPALAAGGVIEVNTAGANTVTVEVPNVAGFCTLVAVMVTPLGLGNVDGAVYFAPSNVPTVAFPPGIPLTDQFTAGLNPPLPVTCAVNNWLAPVLIGMLAGVTVTEMTSAGGGGDSKVELPPPQLNSKKSEAKREVVMYLRVTPFEISENFIYQLRKQIASCSTGYHVNWR